MQYDFCKHEIEYQWVKEHTILMLKTSSVLYISNGTAKTRLAIMPFLYCEEFVKTSSGSAALPVKSTLHILSKKIFLIRRHQNGSIHPSHTLDTFVYRPFTLSSKTARGVSPTPPARSCLKILSKSNWNKIRNFFFTGGGTLGWGHPHLDFGLGVCLPSPTPLDLGLAGFPATGPWVRGAPPPLTWTLG